MKKEIPADQCLRLTVTYPVMVVTTLHANGVVNGGAFGSWSNLSPTEIGMAIGKPSHTYQNIKRTGEFVINIPGADLVDSLAIFGEDYPATVSEVEQAGLTCTPGQQIAVPHIEECVASIECRSTREFPIGYHNFVVGEVLGGYCNEDCLDPSGAFDVVQARVLHCVNYPVPIYATFGGYVKGK
ncbi:flavin reductase family protein [bacterium]|nr:flavin reductase family protein [bacterium]